MEEYHKYDTIIRRIFPNSTIRAEKLLNHYENPDLDAFCKVEVSIDTTHFFHLIFPAAKVSKFMNRIYIHDYVVKLDSENDWDHFGIKNKNSVKAKVIYEGPILSEAEMEFILTNLDTIGSSR